jgi:polyisoprenoid-binding protein YceI
MKRLAPLLLLALPLAASAADTYSVEPGHTSATFAFKHLGFSTFHGKFAQASGTVTIDQAGKKGEADISFDAKGITTGVPKLDEHLASKDFFDVEKYPKITFKSKDFTFTGNTLSEVKGDLTIHGVTKPVTLKVTSFACKDHPMMKVPACGADASTTIKRSEFGVGAFVPAVSDEIPLTIEIEALKKDQPR